MPFAYTRTHNRIYTYKITKTFFLISKKKKRTSIEREKKKLAKELKEVFLKKLPPPFGAKEQGKLNIELVNQNFVTAFLNCKSSL